MKNSLLEAAAEDMKRMRALTQELVEGGNSSSFDKPVDRKVACLSLSEDQSYFDSYAHFGIHLEMLSVILFTPFCYLWCISCLEFQSSVRDNVI